MLTSRAMSSPQSQVRRATIDDLSKLAPLWRAEGLASQDLEKRFKEFQIIEAEGEIQIGGQEGRLHSEVYAYPEQADVLRAQLWERVQTVATNHGLIRLWTQFEAPFWRTAGFTPASGELAARLPGSFIENDRPWAFVQLRSEAASTVSLDKEFAMFKEAERERTERMFRQARVLKMIAVVVAVAVLCLVILWAFYFVRLRGGAPR
jgi:hypothetical protein